MQGTSSVSRVLRKALTAFIAFCDTHQFQQCQLQDFLTYKFDAWYVSCAPVHTHDSFWLVNT